MRVLLLGGTGEARALASVLVAEGHDVTTSLAGRVARPRLPVGQVRIGGFGGVEGLRAALPAYDVVVDATHPFAATISAHAAAACADRVPLLRLARPGWSGDFTRVGSHEDAARVAASLGSRPFLTVGRQSLAAFVEPLRAAAALVRVVDPPELDLPAAWTVLLARGPYTLDTESALLQEHRTDVLVTKDSGGALTHAKLDAAAALDVPVVMVERPAPPTGVRTVDGVEDAARWVRSR